MAHQPDDRSGAPPAPPAAPAGSSRVISPQEIQQKEFRVSRLGGYRMRDVDEFLDQLTESVTNLLEDNRRLRTHVNAAPVVGAPDLDDVARQADEIIQRARDEAARITADARATGAAASTPAERAAVGAFLSHEKGFLQDLAGLVQQHAESVKAMAKQARSTAPAPAAAPAPASNPVAGRDQEAPAVAAEVAEEPPEPERTQALPAEEPIRVEEPMPAATGPSERTPAPGDPSLKELFWGDEG